MKPLKIFLPCRTIFCQKFSVPHEADGRGLLGLLDVVSRDQDRRLPAVGRQPTKVIPDSGQKNVELIFAF